MFKHFLCVLNSHAGSISSSRLCSFEVHRHRKSTLVNTTFDYRIVCSSLINHNLFLAVTVKLASPSPPAVGGAGGGGVFVGGSAPKRKRVTGETKFYAVRRGHYPGIYTNWKDCLQQVSGFKGASFKSFSTEADAKSFIEGQDPTLNPGSSVYVEKWYGVRSGKQPGVYQDWDTARSQVVGWQKPKVKAFATREEAEAFVASGPGGATSPVPEDRRRSRESQSSKKGAAIDGSTELVSKKRKTNTALDVAGIPTDRETRLEPTVEGLDVSQILNQEVAIENSDSADRVERSKSKIIAPTATTAAAKKSTAILKIYTDGSALGNGRTQAAAGVGVWFGSNDTRNLSEPLAGPRQTNQRAELTAILRAIEIAPKHREILIFSDSQYAINCVTLWHHNWSRNNWFTAVGKKVENQDLIEEILDKIQERDELGVKTGFEWVKGHTGNTDGNSHADKLAVEGARRGNR